MPIGRQLNRPLRPWPRDAVENWQTNRSREIGEAATALPSS